MQSFIQKQENFKLGSKNTLSIFGLQFNKNYYQIFNQYSQICNIKFHLKQQQQQQQKYSWDQIWSLWVFGMGCWKTIVIFVFNTLQFI